MTIHKNYFKSRLPDGSGFIFLCFSPTDIQHYIPASSADSPKHNFLLQQFNDPFAVEIQNSGLGISTAVDFVKCFRLLAQWCETRCM